MDNVKIMRLGELSQHLAEKFVHSSYEEFPNCDITDCFGDGETIEAQHRGASSWHGIMRIKTGFDSDEVILAADYYGGGKLHVDTVVFGAGVEEVASIIANLLAETMDLDGDEPLMVEF